MIIFTRDGRHVDVRTSTSHPTDPNPPGLGSSQTWISFHGRPFVRSNIASLHKLRALWTNCDDPESAWFITTGEEL